MKRHSKRALLISGIQDFFKDLINPKLIVLKFTFLSMLTAVVLLWPQLTIHQKVLGLTEYQTGIFSTTASIFTIFSPFLGGIVGDKLGNFRIIMVISSIVSGVFALLFSFVPTAFVEETDVVQLNATDANSSDSSLVYNLSSPNTKTVDESRLNTTFWVYFVVRIGYGLFYGIAYTLFEAAVMANVQNTNINYGYQRAWGTVGAFIGSYIGGLLVEQTGGYDVIFYVSAAIQLLTSILMLLISTDFKVPAQSLTRDIFKHLFNLEVVLFFSAILAAGMFIGYFETFMYRYLFELGATPVLIGLTVTVGAPFELLLTLVSAYFVKLMGHAPIIMIGLSAYGFRFLGFSFLQDPWWVLSLEVLESVANGLMFTAAIMYCTVLFPIETIATFRGIFGAVYFGIGKLIGTAIGSEIRERLGHVVTFRIWAAVAFAISILYVIAYLLQKKYFTGTFTTKQLNVCPGETEETSKDCGGIDNKALDKCE